MKHVKLFQSYLFQTPNEQINTVDPYCASMNSTCGIDINVIKSIFLPHNCNDFMLNLTFLGKYYENCGDIFQTIETEMGTCFTSNNIIFKYASSQFWFHELKKSHFSDLNYLDLPLKYTRTDFNRTMSFRYTEMDTALFNVLFKFS